MLEVAEKFLPLFWGGWAFVRELADGIAQVGHCVPRVEKRVASQMIDDPGRFKKAVGVPMPGDPEPLRISDVRRMCPKPEPRR
jgi:hypothetical protein